MERPALVADDEEALRKFDAKALILILNPPLVYP